MEKSLEPTGRATDEWVWLRLSDAAFFPAFDTFLSQFRELYVFSITSEFWYGQGTNKNLIVRTFSVRKPTK